MQGNNKTAPQPHWLLLGATGLLQPLSEDFLYRSAGSPDRACWQALPVRTARGGRRNA